jgi:hypothetical protein
MKDFARSIPCGVECPMLAMSVSQFEVVPIFYLSLSFKKLYVVALLFRLVGSSDD